MKLKRATKNQFKIIIEQDSDGYFVASVPSLPGCHTQAKNLPDLMERVRDAIEFCLAVARENAAYKKRISYFAYDPAFVGMDVITL